MPYIRTREDEISTILVQTCDQYLSTLRDQITTLYLALGNETFESDGYIKSVRGFAFDVSVLADDLAKELNKAQDLLSKRRVEIDHGEVRRRIHVAADALNIDERDTGRVLEKDDEELTVGTELVDFAKYHGLPLDWLLAGDVTPLLQAADKRHGRLAA